jgi:hypothetical protein
MFGQGLDFGSITNVGEPLVTSFTSTSTVVNSSLTALYGISYNPNDGYIYTREQNFGPTTFTGLIKRNATTGAYISQAGNFLNVGFNIQFFDIDSSGNVWIMQRNSTSSIIRKYDLNANYLNVQYAIVPYYGNGVAIDTSQTPNVIYGCRAGGSDVYRINTNGVSQGAVNIQGGNNSEFIFYCSPSQIIRLASSSASTYRYNINTNANISIGSVTNAGPNGGAYNPIDKIAWLSNGNTSMRKFTANF